MWNERSLQHDRVGLTVSEGSVVLDGEVLNHEHRYLAIQIAIAYAGTRTVVDHLRLRGER
jgi:osmotically-inducible protein OsmY